MTHYELEDENMMPCTMNWSVVSHFAINHPKLVNDFFCVPPYRQSMRCKKQALDLG